MTYKEAQDLFKRRYGKNIKSSYIADVRNSHGKLDREKSPLRKGNYKYPCPADLRSNLEKVLKELKMI